jgi:Na+-translocating ferredoxin:NAD+ oxidoreductase RnfD subunit/Pyruvate/2-oxoacid:ferredoxin oxidoreductase delta subunit
MYNQKIAWYLCKVLFNHSPQIGILNFPKRRHREMSKPKDYSWMTKNKLMTYTFIALVILAGVSAISFWPTGITISVIAVTVAVALDYVMALAMKTKAPRNTMSAAVFGLIVALSYSLGLPSRNTVEVLPLIAPEAYYFVAAISALGMILLKKGQSLLGRKYVNPAAAAKLLVLFPFLDSILLAKDHLATSFAGVGLPALTSPIGYSGSGSFAFWIQACLGNSTAQTAPSAADMFYTYFIQKLHGWTGGASSLAVIVVGLALFIVCRKYIKWRITTAYFGSVTLMSVLMWAVYGGDPLLRLGFELFIGSSIFLAFFMLTDPATTPLTYAGQAIFGVGVGILTVIIQTYMNFLGGSILALVIMNLTSPLLDRVGLPKPSKEKKNRILPKAEQFETVTTVDCIRCGECIVACCHNLSPILIKEAFDKNNMERLTQLRADLCDSCGDCNYVCPARIDLNSSILKAKMSMRRVRAYSIASAAVTKTLVTAMEKGLGTLEGKEVTLLAGTGPVGQIAARIYAAEKANVTITSRSMTKGQAVADKINKEVGAERVKVVEVTKSEHTATAIKNAEIILSAGAAATQFLSTEDLNKSSTVKIVADINAIRPLGVEGIAPADNGKEIKPGVYGIGALPIDELKNKTEKEMIKQATTEHHGHLDYAIAYNIAKEQILKKPT